MSYILFFLVALFVFLFIKSRKRNKSASNYISIFFAFFIFYNGWAITTKDITNEYIFIYIIFTFSLLFSFLFFYKVFYKIEYSSNLYFGDFVEYKITARLSYTIIFVYLFCVFFPLIYPSFNLANLLSPPKIDLRETFSRRLDGLDSGFFISLVSFVKLLIFPLFLIALQKRYNKISIVFVFMMLIFYVEFVITGYKSRGQLLSALFPILALYWYQNPSKRFLITLCITVAAPFTFVLFAFYANFRLQGELSLSDFNIMDSIVDILNSETSFVLTTGIPLIESRQNVDLINYFKWIVTLPFPKFLIGAVSGARLNSEISEIVLGVKEGSSGYYIVLPGIVAESVYVYGMYFFGFMQSL